MLSNKVVVVLLLAGALFIFSGCDENTTEENESVEEEITVEEVESELDLDTVIDVSPRQAVADRLPGSLKWGSIVIYKTGDDFLSDNPDGLKAVSLLKGEDEGRAPSVTSSNGADQQQTEPTPSSSSTDTAKQEEHKEPDNTQTTSRQKMVMDESGKLVFVDDDAATKEGKSWHDDIFDD